uniref:Migration and invasion enhancer 1 n=1 Tax=Dromaius novaehollandiae TaxID=8790 RepID=A0A8C4JBH1_DRONO
MGQGTRLWGYGEGSRGRRGPTPGVRDHRGDGARGVKAPGQGSGEAKPGGRGGVGGGGGGRVGSKEGWGGEAGGAGPHEPCGFEPTYQELASAVKEEYPDIEIESRLGGTGAFEIEINGQLVFSKLENGGFPYEKDLIEAIRRARNGEPLEKITNSRPPCVIL